MERVPAGTSFYMNITLRIYKDDDEENMIELIKEGLNLVSDDYLGSSGSRGYGKVKFLDLKKDNHPLNLNCN